MKKYLIINADDFGLSPAVNRGIIELHRAGVVSSATIMVNMPGFAEAAQLAREAPRLGVGLHFNLSYGEPLCAPDQVGSLIDEQGAFSEQVEGWREEEVARELAAQWQRLVEAGISPTHLDSHRHMQVHTVVYRPLEALARREGLPLRRVEGEPVLDSPRPPCADYTFLNTYFQSGGKELLLDTLESLQPGVSELMCHPGYVDEVLKGLSSWTQVRRAELAVLGDAQVKSALIRTGIHLINYRQMMRLRKTSGGQGRGRRREA